MTSQLSHWRLMLREYLDNNPDEKKRIANALNVNVRTLDRWTAGTSDPSRPVVPRLATVIHGKETEMRLSLEREYPSAFERSGEQDILSNVPGPFYERALETKAMLANPRPIIMGLVGKQLCLHLDPDGKGLMLLFAQCVKPAEDSKISSLFVHKNGYGTKLWQYQQVGGSYHIGRDSLCAVAIEGGRVAVYPGDIAALHPAPLLYPDEINSAAAYPLYREGNIAGALFLVATEREFFTPGRRELIVKYSNNFATALRDSEFYPARQIELFPMPTPSQQTEILWYAQKLLQHLAEQYPDETIEQLEERGRTIFHEQCGYIEVEKETTRARK